MAAASGAKRAKNIGGKAWRRGWTAERRQCFLEMLAVGGNVSTAAHAAGYAHSAAAYRLRYRDPEFAAAWDAAIAEAVARIESSLVARAVAEIEARNATLEAQGPDGIGEGMSFEQMMKLLAYYRSAQDKPVRGGPKRRYASREETDAALNAALDAIAVRTRARKKREAAERKVARQAGQEVSASGRR